MKPPAATSEAIAETYSHRDNPAMDAWMATRTATREAAFFLPYLRPGMRLLDVGCGPGAITQGLAKVIAPGAVVGIDLQPTQVARARMLEAKSGAGNARFAVANCYQLPFLEDSFDAVFAHAALMHLREPLRALTEMRRVLRPGESSAFAIHWSAEFLTP